MANKVLDIKNIFNSKKEYEKEKIAFDFYTGFVSYKVWNFFCSANNCT